MGGGGMKKATNDAPNRASRCNRAGRWLDEQFTTRWEKNTLRVAAQPKPAVIEVANRRIARVLLWSGTVAFVVGLIFPAGGPQALGALGTLISWAADTVPSINKAAAISPMSDLVRGYLGTLALMVPVIAFLFLYKEPFGERSHYAFNRPGVSPGKVFVIGYLIGIPFSCFVLWFFWALPIAVHLGMTPTRGQLIFHLMMTNRLMLAVFGAGSMVGVALFVSLVSMAVLGPFYRLFR